MCATSCPEGSTSHAAPFTICPFFHVNLNPCLPSTLFWVSAPEFCMLRPATLLSRLCCDNSSCSRSFHCCERVIFGTMWPFFHSMLCSFALGLPGLPVTSKLEVDTRCLLDPGLDGVHCGRKRHDTASHNARSRKGVVHSIMSPTYRWKTVAAGAGGGIGG
jgi:hypothetical protein